MKILLATADVSEARWASEMGILDGVMMPTLPNDDERDVLRELCDIADTPVYAPVRSLGAQEIYRDGRELARVSDQVIVQVPFVEDAVSAIGRLHLEGVRVAATLVFNAAQALLAARAGATAILTSVEQVDSVGHSGASVVGELRRVLDAAGAEADVVAVRPADAAQFSACAAARADGIAVAPDVLRRLLLHPLTDRGMDQFLRDSSHSQGAWSGQS